MINTNQQQYYLSKSTAISQRGSRTRLPSFNAETKNLIKEFSSRKHTFESTEESRRYANNLDQPQKSFFSIDNQGSSRLHSTQSNQTRARSATFNEKTNSYFENSSIQKPKSACIFILRRSASRKKYQNTPIKERQTSITSKGYDSLRGSYIEQENVMKQIIERKEKGWDQYRDYLQKGVNRAGSIQTERASHLTTTPLVNHKNYYDRKREIEQNLNCKEFGLNVQNYSFLDKKTKSFFHNQCKEEAQEFHVAIKEKEQKLNSEINDLIRLSIHNTRTKLSYKYSISKHLEQNRYAQTQLIF